MDIFGSLAFYGGMGASMGLSTQRTDGRRGAPALCLGLLAASIAASPAPASETANDTHLTTIRVLHGASRAGTSPQLQRSLTQVASRVAFPNERVAQAPDGSRVRYTTDESAVDRIDPTDSDGDGRADVLQATLHGLEETRQLLTGRLELPTPRALDVYLVELGEATDGYLVPATRRLARTKMFLDASPRDGAEGARRAAIHQYAHAVALAASPRFPQAWSAALAGWAVTVLDGGPDAATLELFSSRLARLSSGLLARDAPSVRRVSGVSLGH